MHLTRSSIRTDRDTGVRYLHLEEKTGAGVRDVPIHSAIEGTIDRLAEAATSDGYLLHLDSNRYEKRGDAIGKRFTRMKQDLGFDDLHVFHSIRRTVIHLFKVANCPLHIVKDTVGHSREDDITYDGYAAHTPMDQCKAWLEKAVRYPT